ncbi:hypothetical protein D3C85_1082760 [compost metagenome]
MLRTLQRANRIEHAFFVFLHVLVVCQRQRLQYGHQTEQVAIDAACFTTDKLRYVRVLLLRHDRAAGAERIIEFDERELGRRPEHHFLAKARKVHHDHGRVGEELQDEVAVADRV